jgi:hypothetical protein
MRSVRITLLAAVLCTIFALLIVLSGSPLTVVGTNGVPLYTPIAYAKGGTRFCQDGGTLPAGTTAIRVSLSANIGPRVTVTVFSGPTLITSGVHPSGWGVDETVTVGVKPLPEAVPNVFICAALGPAIESIQVNGARVKLTSTSGATRTPVWLRTEYMRPGRSSWLSLAQSVAQRVGFDRAPSGTWLAYLVTMIAVAALASRLILWELR